MGQGTAILEDGHAHIVQEEQGVVGQLRVGVEQVCRCAARQIECARRPLIYLEGTVVSRCELRYLVSYIKSNCFFRKCAIIVMSVLCMK